jgi:hypothetical protein
VSGRERDGKIRVESGKKRVEEKERKGKNTYPL